MNARRQSDAAGQRFLLPAEGVAARQMVAEVAIAARVSKLYAFAIPDALRGDVRAGVVVCVPLGRGQREVTGVCVRVSERLWDHTTRPLRRVMSGETLLTPRLIELGLWLGAYYAYPPGLVLDEMFPAAGARARKRRSDAGASAGAAAEVGEPAIDPDQFELTSGQVAAVDALAGALETPPRFGVHLLFGVPGSGKTEVYVRAIRRAIARREQAILLVPEIALATQMVERLVRRFERVAVLHSRMTPGQRGEALRRIAAGDIDLVIGTRSAVFAPCPRLGLMIVDEEQEGSFKSLAAPFYHARDVAIKRGQIEDAVVVLGTATPALETWHNAHSLPHYHLLRLPERVPGARLPATRLVVTGGAAGIPGRVLSPALLDELRATLGSAKQAILLHNRRGYAPVLRCAACGQTLPCLNCGAHLVLHRGGDGGPSSASLRCHRCGQRSPSRERCADESCGGKLAPVGLAIQRLEEELGRVLPTARILRLDSDTMKHRRDYSAALGRFEARQADVLIGTQMVAKGLDFPDVRLVGVIDADAALWLPDFRAGERVFQLLMQVVGRAGRRAGDSLALVQAGDASPPPIRHALRLDYEAFATEELTIRWRSFLPPFARLIRFVCADPQPARARTAAATLVEGLRRIGGRTHAGIRVDEAEPCPIPRVRELTRWQVLLRMPRTVDPVPLLNAAADDKLLTPRVKRFTVDVDPLDFR